jgi:hypothetical protein
MLQHLNWHTREDRHRDARLVMVYKICGHDKVVVPLVVNTSRSFPHSWLITGFVTRLTQRVPLVEQELLTLPEHLRSSPVFSGVRVTPSVTQIFHNGQPSHGGSRKPLYITDKMNYCVLWFKTKLPIVVDIWYFWTLFTIVIFCLFEN